jgi:hypothetical protein
MQCRYPSSSSFIHPSIHRCRSKGREESKRGGQSTRTRGRGTKGVEVITAHPSPIPRASIRGSPVPVPHNDDMMAFLFLLSLTSSYRPWAFAFQPRSDQGKTWRLTCRTHLPHSLTALTYAQPERPKMALSVITDERARRWAALLLFGISRAEYLPSRLMNLTSPSARGWFREERRLPTGRECSFARGK